MINSILLLLSQSAFSGTPSVFLTPVEKSVSLSLFYFSVPPLYDTPFFSTKFYFFINSDFSNIFIPRQRKREEKKIKSK